MTNESTPPSNPYPKIDRIHRVQGCVNPDDFQYFNTLFPCQHGITSAVIATFFHHICNELRTIDLIDRTCGGPGLSPAWGNLHTNHAILRQILERSTVGGTVVRTERGTDSCGPDVARTIGSVCGTAQPSQVPSNLQSNDSPGECETRSEAEDRTKSSVGTAGANSVEEPLALKLLREQGVLP